MKTRISSVQITRTEKLRVRVTHPDDWKKDEVRDSFLANAEDFDEHFPLGAGEVKITITAVSLGSSACDDENSDEGPCVFALGETEDEDDDDDDDDDDDQEDTDDDASDNDDAGRVV